MQPVVDLLVELLNCLSVLVVLLLQLCLATLQHLLLTFDLLCQRILIFFELLLLIYNCILVLLGQLHLELRIFELVPQLLLLVQKIF